MSNNSSKILKRLTPNISEKTREGKYYQMLAKATYSKGKKQTYIVKSSQPEESRKEQN